MRRNFSGPSGSIRSSGIGSIVWKAVTSTYSEHNRARRGLERLAPSESAELRVAWRRYCDVIAELDRTASEFEALRSCAE